MTPYRVAAPREPVVRRYKGSVLARVHSVGRFPRVRCHRPESLLRTYVVAAILVGVVRAFIPPLRHVPLYGAILYQCAMFPVALVVVDVLRGWRRCRRMRRAIKRSAQHDCMRSPAHWHRVDGTPDFIRVRCLDCGRDLGTRPRTPLDDFMDRCDAAIQADGSD